MEQEPTTALRIILLVLHGLAGAQPLTPVRDDLTYGSVQVGRGLGHYHSVYIRFFSQTRKISMSVEHTSVEQMHIFILRYLIFILLCVSTTLNNLMIFYFKISKKKTTS